jgi:hypothetical protein
MEEFIENAKLLVNTLGHKVFEEKRESTTVRERQIFSISSVGGAKAQGEPTSEGFVVIKGPQHVGNWFLHFRIISGLSETN